MKREKTRKKKEKAQDIPTAFSLHKGMWIAQGRVTVEGVPLVLYSIALPAFLQGEEVGRRARAKRHLSAFYKALAVQIWDACEVGLFSPVRAAYLESEDPEKKYRFARYTLTMDFTVSAVGGVLCVRRQAILSKRGKLLCDRQFCEQFSEKSGWVVLPGLSRAALHVKPKGGLREELKGVLFCLSQPK